MLPMVHQHADIPVTGGCTTDLLEMILVVMLTRDSELPCLSDARSRAWADDLSGHGSMSNGNALS